MAKGRFANDGQLQARMGVTIFGIGLLYTAFVAALIYFLGNYVLVAVIAIGLAFAQWYWSDKMAMKVMGAREVTPEEAPQLHALVDRLCAMSDMEKPRVAISDSDVPNAFATGRSPKHSVICATRGLLHRLEPEEVEGVMAHELAHVAHRDVTVMTIASTLGILAGMIVRFAMYGGLGRGRDDRNGLPVVLVIMLVSIVTYVVSFLMLRALSRYRELAADRGGALVTGKPSALASALTKISGDMARIPTRDLRKVEPANAFLFAPALSSKLSLEGLLATHPPLEKRLENLAKVSAQLGRPY